MGKIIMEEVQIFQNSEISVFEAQERATLDVAIATAKAYPRDLTRVRNNSLAIVLMDRDTAESYRYTKPAGNGKTVSGISVHGARILAQQYGNIRVQKRIKEISQKTIVAEAVAFDLETNYAIAVEARRSILTKNGQRYSDNLIETNAMAVLAIAERNAILAVIPQSISNNIYKEAFAFVNGDLSDEAKVAVARKKMLEFFKDTYKASEIEVCTAVGVNSVNAIKAEEIANLRGFAQALKDAEITADELFKRKKSNEILNPFEETKETKEKKEVGKIKKNEPTDKEIDKLRNEILNEENKLNL